MKQEINTKLAPVKIAKQCTVFSYPRALLVIHGGQQAKNFESGIQNKKKNRFFFGFLVRQLIF